MAFPPEVEAESLADTVDLSGVDVFLDTGIQAQRLFGDPAVRDSIEAALDEAGALRSSSTVFRECHVNVVNGYQFVADTIRDVNDGVLERADEIRRQVAAAPDHYGFTSAHPVAWAASVVESTFAGSVDPDPDDVADFLEAEIDYFRAHRFFETARSQRPIDYTNDIDCEVAAHPVGQDGGRASCRESERSCDVRPVLVRIRRKAGELPPEWRERRPQAWSAVGKVEDRRRWIRRDRTAPGESLCWPLADLVVAEELRDGELLLTTDIDFADIRGAYLFDVVVVAC